MTKKKRTIKIFNMVSKQEDTLQICSEDNISTIQKRYFEFNKHASSYTWKALNNGLYSNLDMEKTLETNGVMDESSKFESVGLGDNFFVPTLFLYYNDDLTSA